MPSFNTGPDKEAFLRYLDDFDAVADPDALFDELLSCEELLPLRQVETLGLPVGSTYRDAVRLLLGSWNSAD
jgi:hypothetical protein